MSAAPRTSGDIRAITAAIALVVLVGLGLSILNPLLAIRMELDGISAFASGLTASAAGLGTVMVMALLSRLTGALGVVGVLVGAIALAIAVTLALAQLDGLWSTTLARFLLGAALGLIFTLSEFWINTAAPPARRGTVIGLYATVLYAGFALGPLLLGLFGKPEAAGTLPYLVTAAIMALALLPLMLARERAPRLGHSVSAAPWRFIRAAPAATLGAFLFGVVEIVAMLLLPVYGLRSGFSTQESTWLVTSFTLGNVALQVPLGLLSDRVNRLALLGAVALGSALFLLVIAAAPGLWTTLALLFFAGGISGGIYPLALALLGERFTDADLAAASSAVVVLYSSGMIVGPPLMGEVVDRLGPVGLPLGLGVPLALYGAVLLLAAKKAPATP